MDIIAVAALTEKKVIGKDNWMPWDLPDELTHFRTITRDGTIIMGRKTFDSVGRGMPNRDNIIVSRSMQDPGIERLQVAHSIEEAIDKAKIFGKPIYVIGGAEIYKLALPYLTHMWLSFIKEDYEGDTFFPEWDKTEWEQTLLEDKGKWIFTKWEKV